MKTLVSILVGGVLLFGSMTLASPSANAGERQDKNNAQNRRDNDRNNNRRRHHRRHRRHRRHARHHDKLSY